MAGYIGSKTSVAQVDGYTRTEADAGFVSDPNGAVTVDGSGNVGIGTSSPSAQLELSSATDYSGLKVSGTNHKLIAIETTTSNRQVLTSYKSGSHEYSIGLGTSDEFSFYDNTSAEERMRIDSAGRVTMPYQPFFKARSQPNVNITTQGQVLPFDVVDTNIGNHYNNSTFTFTAPVNGSYVFNVMLFTPPNQTSFDYFYLNGVRQTSIEQNHAPTGYTNRSDAFVVYLVAGDAVSMIHWLGTTHLNGSFAGPHSYFSGYLLG